MWTCHSISFIEAVKMQSASAMLFSLCYGFLIIILTLISFWIYHNCIIFKMLRMDQLVFCVMPMIPAYLLINWRQMNQERDTCSVWSEMFEMFFFYFSKNSGYFNYTFTFCWIFSSNRWYLHNWLYAAIFIQYHFACHHFEFFSIDTPEILFAITKKCNKFYSCR